MAQEAYGFNAQTMREVIRRLDDVDKTYDMIRRRLATFSTRRHEAVYMPGSASRLVKFDWLPAAYGGSRTGITGAAATTNGNTNPDNLQYFPKACEVCDLESSGDFDDGSTDNQIYCANLGSLPLTNGYAIAYKLTDSDPNFGTVWAIDNSLVASHYNAAYFTWTESTQGTHPDDYWEYVSGDSKLIRTLAGCGFGTSGGNDARNWAFGWGSSGTDSLGDVMLSHVGQYEITFGFTGYIEPDTSGAYITHTTGDSSTTIKIPVAMNVRFGFHANFEPGTTTIGTLDNGEEQISVRIPGNIYSTAQYRHYYQRTFVMQTGGQPWHGQHHTRLSPFISVIQDSKTGGNDLTFVMIDCWLTVRPAKRISSSSRSAYDWMDTGANQYPGGYNTPSAGGGTFVWYGGGSEPDDLDEDGTAV